MKELPGMVQIKCKVASGRGHCSHLFDAHGPEFDRATGEKLVIGSLNLISSRPIRLIEDCAVTLASARRLLWPAKLYDLDVWICRWGDSPLHIIEILSSVHLRKQFNLENDDEVVLQIAEEKINPLSLKSRISFNFFWIGRKNWYYSSEYYPNVVKNYAVKLEATQTYQGNMIQNIARFGKNRLKSVAAALPSPLNPFPDTAGAESKNNESFQFERRTTDSLSGVDFEFAQLVNLLNFAKTSGTTYSAKDYEGGYYTFEFKGHSLEGQRNLQTRFKDIPLDFENMTVLDLGCNRGGVLYDIANKIKWGVGVDYDPKLINTANKLRALSQASNLDFYFFDLEKYDLHLLKDLMPSTRVDVVFALAICMWLSNWKDVLDFSAEISNSMIFESNGSDQQQQEQETYLRGLYQHVDLISSSSVDDPRQKNRKLFFCRHVV
ncbi:methyltransferase domain-containing protein [Salinisphaera sp.]|uniref:methyltransferase domain-containing protein n=1 Tax=Salinisphaera sp. TaxID=1914330 RepID=UPI002D79C8F0|nr:methyltransferase domain-containing protein [Salinisphaera sp.]HET7314558.1 methyltransferase domain-containing protein [Salinisphaera sp.]